MTGFRTRRGECRLRDGYVRLDGSALGRFRRYWASSRLWFAGLVALTAQLAWNVHQYLAYPRVVVAVAGVAAVVRFVGPFRGYTRADEIPVGSIEGVRAKPAVGWPSHPQLIVEYGVADHTRKRKVRLPPNRFDDTESEFERAKAAFRERGVDVVEEADGDTADAGA